MKALNELIQKGQYADAWQRLRALTLRAREYAELTALTAAFRRLAARDPDRPTSTHVRIALLGTGTTDLIAPALGLVLEIWNLRAEIHRADYNTYAREMLDADSATARFRPDVAVVVNSPTSLPARPAAGDDETTISARVREVADHWLGLCRSLHDHARCEIVLDNYHALTASPYGNLGAKLPWDVNTFLARVNLEIGAIAPPFVHINDVGQLAARQGLRQWFDPRHWYESKLPMSPGSVLPYTRRVAAIIGALYGRSAKCVVLDLDNTVWGGVVGDDGVEGIRIGEGDPVGEAFLAFQRYLVGLRQRGMMLAVSSKNEERNALAPFAARPEMALTRDDFVAFRANWDPKPGNLRAIARELNIGLDALVFVDDNPREREHVRQELPEVRVVEMTTDPADYPRLLDETGWLEVVHIGDEDRARTKQYRANQRREELKAVATDYEGYLGSLMQVGAIAAFDTKHLDRIAQLVNKTNQFNLTTRRQTRSEVEVEMNDPTRLTAYVRLADRFGDNGLICVFSARREGDALFIDQWLMSCRVLSRGVERLLLNWVVEKARAAGVRTIHGTYIPTARNGLVAGHYAALGFTQVEPAFATAPGTASWRLAVETYVPATVNIELADDHQGPVA